MKVNKNDLVDSMGFIIIVVVVGDKPVTVIQGLFFQEVVLPCTYSLTIR